MTDEHPPDRDGRRIVDGPRFDERITVIRCVGCEQYLTGDLVTTDRGKIVCPRCGTTIRGDHMTTYILNSVVEE